MFFVRDLLFWKLTMLIPLFSIHCSRCVYIEGKRCPCFFFDEFMTQYILDSIDMKDTHIIYSHYYLKFDLEKTLLMKWKVL